MADVDVTITDNSGEVRRELDEAIEKALTEIGIEAEKHAKKIMEHISPKPPIDTGALRNSITWAIGGQRANNSDYSGTAPKRDEPCVYLGSNKTYAVFVEEGTSIYNPNSPTSKPFWFYKDDNGKWHKAYPMKPRPFIKPAIEDFRDEYKEIIENNLKGGG